MKTNEQILAQEVISCNDIKLLKRRSNNEKKDVINYDNFEPIQIDTEGGAKGLEWLKSLLNSKGKPKNGVPFGNRELNIISKATNEDFYFCGFYDAGNNSYNLYLPIYEVLGMEYIPYCRNEIIYIVG